MNNTLFNLLVFIGIGSTLLTVMLLIIFSIALFNFYINKKSRFFPKKTFYTICILGVLSFTFWISSIVNPHFLPQGYLGQSFPSPNGEFNAQIYHMSGFIDYKNVRVDVVNNRTNKKEMIYYEHVYKALDIKWIENDTLKIEDIILKVERDNYDYRDHQ